MTERVEEARGLLARLKGRLVAGEIDRAEFAAQRDLILADLDPLERTALGGATPTPQPTTGFGPGSGARPLGPAGPSGTAVPLGPSGGRGGGMHTTLASLSDLELAPGSTLLEQWTIVRELGRGGFGAVFEAEETHLHERQAVKVLDPAMVAKEELLGRFRREVSVMRKLVHPRIVRVFDYREAPSELVALISMELVAGGSVRDLIAAARERGMAVPVPLAATIVEQILEALAEAHAQKVIHRDVTPGNVLLAGGAPAELLADPSRDPRVKLVDFGIAAVFERSELSQKSRVLGTAAYVAPEILDPAGEVTPAADVYGAGAIAYELLTGQLPLGRYESPRELRAEIPPELDSLVLAMLARAPGSRPAAAQAIERLRAPSAPAAAVSPAPAPAPTAVERTGGRVQLSTPPTAPFERAAAPPFEKSAPVRRSALPIVAAAAIAVAAGIGWMTFRGGGEKAAAPQMSSGAPPQAAIPAAPAPGAPSAQREDPAAATRRLEEERQAEERRQAQDAERKARERIDRYLDRAALVAGAPAAMVIDSSGRVIEALTTSLNESLGGSPDLFRPAFSVDGLLSRAAQGDRSVLAELGLGGYRADVVLLREELTLQPDSLAPNLTVASVSLTGRLYRAGRTASIRGQARQGDFNRERAIEKARTSALAELVVALESATPR